MKKIIRITALLLIAVLTFSACEAKGKTIVSMYDLSKAMTGATDKLAEMTYVSSSDSNPEESLSYVVDCDYSKVDSFFVSYATSGVDSCDEIVVIALKDKNDATEIEKLLNDHLEQRISMYKTYGASMVPKLEKGEVFTKDNYAVLIVADDSAAIHKAFDSFIAQS